jgi:hypothetical protein
LESLDRPPSSVHNSIPLESPVELLVLDLELLVLLLVLVSVSLVPLLVLSSVVKTRT